MVNLVNLAENAENSCFGQNKIGCEILAISFVFWAILKPKMALPEAALPMGSQSSSIYFWNQWNQENGISFSANSNFDFCFFCPPLIVTIKPPIRLIIGDM